MAWKAEKSRSNDKCNNEDMSEKVWTQRQMTSFWFCRPASAVKVIDVFLWLESWWIQHYMQNKIHPKGCNKDGIYKNIPGRV